MCLRLRVVSALYADIKRELPFIVVKYAFKKKTKTLNTPHVTLDCSEVSLYKHVHYLPFRTFIHAA